MSERNPYLSLMEYGMAFVKDAINIDAKAYEGYSVFVDSKADKFKKLFTTINKNGSPRYLPNKSLNRYSISGADFNLKNWNNIHKQFNILLQSLKFPVKGNMTPKNIIEFDSHFNVLKSDGSLSDAQQAHTDELPPFSLGTNTKYF